MRRRAILVIRSEDGFSKLLRQSGFEVVNLELIRTEPVDDLSEFAKTVHKISEYDGVFITSPAAAEIFVKQLNADRHTFSGKLYVLGDRAKSMLQRSGMQIEAADDANTAEDLIRSFEKSEFVGKRLLFVRGERSVGTIPKMLEGIATVDETIVYRTVERDPENTAIMETGERLKNGEFEIVCFFSPSGVESFEKLFAELNFEKPKAAAIGDTTAGSARRSGFSSGLYITAGNRRGFCRRTGCTLKRN